jgi:hypothetical protein
MARVPSAHERERLEASRYDRGGSPAIGEPCRSYLSRLGARRSLENREPPADDLEEQEDYREREVLEHEAQRKLAFRRRNRRSGPICYHKRLQAEVDSNSKGARLQVRKGWDIA